MTTPLDPTLLSRLKAARELFKNEKEPTAIRNEAAYESLEALPQLLAHIEAQDKRISAVSGLVEALEAQDHRTECSKEQGCIADCPLALLAAWRKNHG